MKTRLIALLAGLALSGSALAQQRPVPKHDAATQAPAHGSHRYIYSFHDGIPPLPPECWPERPNRHMQRHVPDFSADAEWRDALGISQAQAQQVETVMKQNEERMQTFREQHRAENQATCTKLRSLIGDKAMERWAEASLPPPPPLPPAPPMPPTPPQPPAPPPPPPVDQ